MHRPQQRPKPGTSHVEQPQRAPQRQGGADVKRHIHHMVGQRIQPPAQMLQPEGGNHQRADARVLGGPNVQKPQRPDKAGIVGDVDVVVPNEARVPDAAIGKHDDSDKDGDGQPGLRRREGLLHAVLQKRVRPRRSPGDRAGRWLRASRGSHACGSGGS